MPGTPRLVRLAGCATLPDDGTAEVVFDQPFKHSDDSEPIILASATSATSEPVVVHVAEKLQNTQGEWTGARLQAARMVALPTTILNLGQLNGFIVAQQSGLAGVQVDWVAI